MGKGERNSGIAPAEDPWEPLPALASEHLLAPRLVREFRRPLPRSGAPGTLTVPRFAYI